MKNSRSVFLCGLILAVAMLWPTHSFAGDYDKEIARQQAVVAREPDNLDAAYNLGKLLSWDGRHEEAIQVFKYILARDPKHRDADIGWARVLAWSGKQEQAILKFEELTTKYPGHFETYQGLGSLYLWGNHFEKAIGYFKKALELKPDDIVSLKGLGRSYLGRGDQGRADLFFTRAQLLELRRTPLRLAMVLAILLGAGVALFLWARGRSIRQKKEALKMELKLLRYALALYQHRTGKFPLALEALLTEKWQPPGSREQHPMMEGMRLGDRGVIVDGFKNRYFYNPDQGSVHSSTPGCEGW